MDVRAKKIVVTTGYWTVKTKDPFEVGNEFKKRPNKHAGLFQPFLDASFKTKDGVLFEVVLKPTAKLTLPKWPHARKAGCKAEWDRFMVALKKHEGQHALVLLESVARYGLELYKYEEKLTKDGKSLTPSVFSKWLKANKTKWLNDPTDLLDKATKHGENIGAVFDATKCG